MNNCAILLFGATGDLTKRKLIPALFEAYRRGTLGSKTPVICIGRQRLSKKEFVKKLQLERFIPDASPKLKNFLNILEYSRLSFDGSNLQEFADEVEEVTQRYKVKGNRLFYLALPNNLFGRVVKLIKLAGLLDGEGWKRLAYEKPYGNNLRTATELNTRIRSVFPEESIYRIDHYVAKKLVQNILVFRFANSIFEQIWNKEFIDHVQITVAEEIGVEDRGQYYDSAGAIKDFLQNHLLQLLAYITTEAPLSLEGDDLRTEKIKVFNALRPLKSDEIVTGQYGGGVLHGQRVRAYRREHNVSSDSKTETFVAIKAHVDTPRWKGVPFYIRTGKRLATRAAHIHVVLRDVVCNLFCTEKIVNGPNVISIRIQPNHGISIHFNAKKAGGSFDIQPVSMNFNYKDVFGLNTPKAYEAIITELLAGNQALFTRWDGAEAMWKYTDPIVNMVHRRKVNIYKPGSLGPAVADELLKRDGRAWIDPLHEST